MARKPRKRAARTKAGGTKVAPKKGGSKSTAGKRAQRGSAKDDRLYTLDVFIIGGLVTEQFAEKNPEVSRTIQIRGDQTLEHLHYAIFEAFDRFDEHMYEFQFGKGPQDPRGKRYVLRFALEGPFPPERVAGVVDKTTIGSLDLKVNQAFGYWFDFGDDWWHQINVVAIDDKAPRDKYPKVTKRVGPSPPQYPDWDDDDGYDPDWDDED
jgi:hypothetical protein